MSKINFPVPVTQLLEFIPHRGSAIWIDEVIGIDHDGGRCQVKLTEGHYLTGQKLRASSFIEFIAQSYGFISACNLAFGLKPDQKKISQAFLVGVKNFEILSTGSVGTGDFLTIEVKRTHEVGEISIVEGQVFSSGHECLARGQIKLFAR